jgi:hypothetical protein
MEITRHKDNIFTVDNFLTEKESKAIVDYLDMLVQMGYLDWNQISFYGSLAMGYWPSDNNLLAFGLPADYFDQLKERIKKATEKCIGTDLTEVSYHAQKWIEGAFADYHSDNSDEHGNPTAFEKSKYATFIYLNDNFEGGLLKFKSLDYPIQPKVGMLAAFDGGADNMHAVTTVKNGERYTVGSFWDRADSVYDDDKKQKWEDELSEVRAEQKIMYEKWELDREKGIVPILPEEDSK